MTKVLVVEDETSYSEALSYVLRKEGFEVAIAETGPDALTEFDRGGADIVLLDLMLPGLSGTEVCRAIRQISSVPIIMVSAKDTEVDKVVGLELGADDYVTKPYSPRELVARIRAVLRRGFTDEVDDNASLENGRVRMDVDRHLVTIDGLETKFPLKEFELLEYFLRNPGRVLTRGQLIDRVWGRGLRRRHQDPRRPRQAPASQDREGPHEPDHPDDGAGSGVQVRLVALWLRRARAPAFCVVGFRCVVVTSAHERLSVNRQASFVGDLAPRRPLVDRR